MRGLNALRELVDPPPETDPMLALVDVAKALTERGAKTAGTGGGPQETPPVVAKRPTGGAELVPLSELQVDHEGGSQRPPDRTKVAEFVRHLRAGGKLPPIKVNQRPDGSRWITDGQHRAAAAAIVGRTTIPAEVTYKPSQEEAQDVEIVAKIDSERDGEVAKTLTGAGATRVGKRLVLDLGPDRTVEYLPHFNRWVGDSDRGLLRVSAPDARRVLDRLGIRP